MTWDGRATVGFNAGGTLFRNYPFSGSSAVTDVACSRYTTSVWNNQIYHLIPSGKVFAHASIQAFHLVLAKSQDLSFGS